jgi:hypothetical protein
VRIDDKRSEAAMEKENNKDTFRMKSFKIILAVFLLSIINAQTEKMLINKVYSGHDITISWN